MRTQQNMNDTAAVIEAATEFVRPLVLERFREDSCVSTVRVCIDTLAYFGVHAVPVPVEVTIFNDHATEMLNGGASLDEVGLTAHAHTIEDPEGPWTIGLGFQVDVNKGGHVGMWVPSNLTFADPSLDQVSRPKKGLSLTGLCIPDLTPGEEVPTSPRGEKQYPDILPPNMMWGVDVPQPAGRGPASVLYRVTGNQWFRSSPNWRRTSTVVPVGASAFREITGEAINRIRTINLAPQSEPR